MRYLGLVFTLVVVTALAACQPRATKEHEIVSSVLNNRAGEVSEYLNEGGDPHRVNREGDPLIYIAVGSRGGYNVAVLLLKAGADPNAHTAKGRSALTNAVGWCNVDIVRILLQAGADVTDPTSSGKSIQDAVCSAPLNKRESVLKLLENA